MKVSFLFPDQPSAPLVHTNRSLAVMTKSPGGGLSTRRRSSSNGGGDTDKASTANNSRISSIASSRPKRRSRGLPLTSRGTPKKSMGDDDDSTVESPTPSPAKSSDTSMNGDNSPPSPNQPHDPIPGTPLLACDTSGHAFTINLIVNGERYPTADGNPAVSRKRSRSNDGTPSPYLKAPLGHDGNLFNCQICHGFGDVVCCDGCPNVYHKQCLPIDEPSRIALENDEDPWFCPACYPKKHALSATEHGNHVEKATGEKETLLHEVKAEEGTESTEEEDMQTRSKTRRHSERQDSFKEEEGQGDEKEITGESPKGDGDEANEKRSTRRRTRSFSTEEGRLEKMSRHDYNETENEDAEDAEEEGSEIPSSAEKQPRKRRRRHLLPGSSSNGSPSKQAVLDAPTKKNKASKKKKKKKKKQQTPERDESQKDEESVVSYTYSSSVGGVVRATPAFCFFLGENRYKIERTLSRRHRYFNRLPKGYERNELIAKEGAALWTKLRASEVRRFMSMSMEEFEQGIIAWKEEKNLREMLRDTDIDDDLVGDPHDVSPDDEKLTYSNHERLYLGTTVGCKPFKPEPGISHNRVLLELLQDMRFHPVPMFIANRTDNEYGQMDFDRITIPYFDVHGPVSTSLGDECLGCTRGWTHFCNVLKRRVPAVEHRAKLQPPLSSLVATRVGLGLRPKPIVSPQNEESEEDVKHQAPFSCREVDDVKTARNLPIVPWDSLEDSSTRADDIVQFIEEAVSMKVPEPPRPQYPGQEASKKLFMARAALPTNRGRKRKSIDRDEDDSARVINKCGRCRTVIQTDTGCIPCRRAQLVINMSKKAGGPSTPAVGNKPSKAEKGPKSNKVQTYMLGRITMKEGSGEIQPDNDAAVANGILRQRWTPFAIIPPHTLESPMPKPSLAYTESDDSTTEDDQSDGSGDFEEINALGEAVDSAPSKMEEVSNVVSPGKSSDEDMKERAVTSGQKSLRIASKRLRSARVAEQMDEEDRQSLAEKYKQSANELQKKCLNVACCGILLALMRRDPLLLFANPVTAEGYSSIVKNPIDFGKIRSSVLARKYGTLGSFVADSRLLCTNALAYNPPGSIYWRTAKELYDVLAVMQKRASTWIGAVKDAHAFAWRRLKTRNDTDSKEEDDSDDSSSSQPRFDDLLMEGTFEELRKDWPEAVEMLDNSRWLRNCISADFMRTKENETAYYGSLAVRRAAIAAEASLAPYPDSGGVFNVVGRRSDNEDENLRRLVAEQVSEVIDPVQLKDLPTWREESIVRMMRRAQSRRLDGLTGSINGCARCDGIRVDQELKMAMTAETVRWGRTRRKNNEVARVDGSRIDLSTGLASQNTQARLEKIRTESQSTSSTSSTSSSSNSSSKHKNEYQDLEKKAESARDVSVSVKGSRIHGWGLVADQPFRAGDVVAEYVGEYVSLAVTEAREKKYQEQRIQDYQFRLDDQLVIDATMRGGHGRYINHNCSPNCVAKMIPGLPPNEHLKRVIIMAHRDIKPMEELTYDYQFPLELDLEARIPCNCHSDHCRGFMNWDLPEEGSNNRVFRAQKRGANMRDRIRRLGRPLKGDK